jgi:DNA-binding MarR family transcriptional regulator
MTRKLKQDIKQTKPFDSVETEVYLTLSRLCEELAGPVHKLLKQAGLSQPQYNVLRILRGAGKDGLACREISARMVNRVPDVTRLLDRLEGRRLISRERASQDRRIVCVKITDSGISLISPLDGPLSNVHRESLGRLGKSRLMQLLDLLEEARDQPK